MDDKNPTDDSLNGGGMSAPEGPFGSSTYYTRQGGPAFLVWSMRDVCWALCRFRRRGLLFFAGTIILVLLGLIVCRRVYRSEAKLFVRLGRENASLDPTATTGKVVGINVTRDFEIKSIIEVMSSRELAERVVEKIGFDPPVTSNLGREKAITSLMKDIQVWSPRQTTVISIESKARSPERARDITKTLVDVYLDEHLRLNRTPRAQEFFEEQTNLLRDELDVVSQELRNVKNRFSLASIEGRRDALQAQTSAVETQQIETASAMITTLAKIEAQRESLNLLSVLNQQELEVKKLQRRVQVVETNYLTYATSLEETRVDQALQEAEISNISVVQPANLVQKPISPRKGLTLALTLVVATVGGLALPLLSAQLDQSLRNREDVEYCLNAPLLAAIPRTNPNSMTIWDRSF